MATPHDTSSIGEDGEVPVSPPLTIWRDKESDDIYRLESRLRRFAQETRRVAGATNQPGIYDALMALADKYEEPLPPLPLCGCTNLRALIEGSAWECEHGYHPV